MRFRRVTLWTLACLFTLASLAGAQLRPQAIPLHSAVTSGSANGTTVPTLGYDAVAVQNTIASAWDGVLTYETTTDGTTWVSVMCRNTVSNVLTTTTTAAAGSVVCPVAGTQSFRARISGRTTGSVTATAVLAGIEAGVVGGVGTSVGLPAAAACKTVTVNSQGSANAGITVDASAGGVTVLAASTTRCAALISNLIGGGDILCAPAGVTPTTTVGFYISSGQSVALGASGQQAWKCIRQGSTSATVYVLEETP